MDNIDAIFGKLEKSEEEEIFRFAGMLTDPLTRKVLAKLASPQSPISTDSVPIRVLQADKEAIILRLNKLENVKLLKSEKVKADNGFCKKYFINDSGREIVSKYMKNEAKQFA